MLMIAIFLDGEVVRISGRIRPSEIGLCVARWYGWIVEFLRRVIVFSE